HVLDAAALLFTHVNRTEDAALLLGATDELRRLDGTSPRLWELRSLAAVEELLAEEHLEAARAQGRTFDIDAAIDYATRTLATFCPLDGWVADAKRPNGRPTRRGRRAAGPPGSSSSRRPRGRRLARPGRAPPSPTPR